MGRGRSDTCKRGMLGQTRLLWRWVGADLRALHTGGALVFSPTLLFLTVPAA